MTDTDTLVQASVSALEFSEAAWEADDLGRAAPDASDLSDTTLMAIMRYPASELPIAAKEAVEVEATHRGLLMSVVDRWLSWGVLALLVVAGIVTATVLLAS